MILMQKKVKVTLLTGYFDIYTVCNINLGTYLTTDGNVVTYMTGLPQGVESQDSEQFFRKVLGVSDGSSLGGMKPILEGSKGELNRSALPQRALLSGGDACRLFCHYLFEIQNHVCCMIQDICM